MFEGIAVCMLAVVAAWAATRGFSSLAARGPALVYGGCFGLNVAFGFGIVRAATAVFGEGYDIPAFLGVIVGFAIAGIAEARKN